MFFRSVFCLVTLLFVISADSTAADWPVWRYDAGHTGASPEKLHGELSLQWSRSLPPTERTWPDDERLEFDIAYEPIIAGGILYIGSPQNDAVMAFDAETGADRWRFYAGGPVRFAPTVAEGLLYAGCDDGYLYCLDALTGEQKWRYKAALTDRKVLGNTRMISVWPVRGAPVVADGVVYFAAGIWPFEGVSVYALDAKTGGIIWINDNCDVKFMMQPHHSPSFSGLAPQGYIAVVGDRLLVPNGRAPAACLDRRTGELLFYDMDVNNRFGDYRVAAKKDFYVNPGAMYRIESGLNLGKFPSTVAMTDAAIVGLDAKQIRAYRFSQIEVKIEKDKRGNLLGKWEAPAAWTFDSDATDLLFAGDKIYACKPGGVFALNCKRKPEVDWEAQVEGTPVRLSAADGRLFVSTLEGRIHCFGKKRQAVKDYDVDNAKPDIAAVVNAQAEEVLKACGAIDGYALVSGKNACEFAAALAAKSQMHVVALAKQEELDAARRKLDATGLNGDRVAVMDADVSNLPQYFASVAVVAGGTTQWAADKTQVQALYERIRPYGGAACIFAADNERELTQTLEKTVADAGLAGANCQRAVGLALLKREGPLPRSADWTHQYADAGNSVVSRDELVRTPLGLLWFGGSSNMDILPRHGHGPSEQVVDGRLFIEGPDMIRALDVYTGRILWQATLPEVGKAYDNTSHQPGANAIGSNYVSVSDGIYVVYGDKCLRLDPATGKLVSEFRLPATDNPNEPPSFGYIGVWEDVLVAGSGPLRYDEEIQGQTWNAVASKRIVAMNRHSGAPLWSITAEAAFRHNAIALGNGKVFCIDRATDELRDRLARRGITIAQTGRMLALDIRTGKEIWRTDKGVYGTWLGYSQERDMLLQAGRASRDMLPDEANDRMTTYNAADGSVIWEQRVKYSGPCMLHGDTIIAQEKFFSLLTGEVISRTNPMTGAVLDMTWQRQHGCNSAVACTNLVTFRSAAAGFFDLVNDSGTGNLGGFRSGCTSNLIAANGVLNAPDYTRTCTCSYQNQTSLALVHTPGVEMWTYNAFPAGEERVTRLGINFGAPGDRRGEDGTLWLDYPSVGGQSPDVPMTVEPPSAHYFRYHSLRLSGDGPAWVAASGVKGARRIRITLEKDAGNETRYTVRLVFAEPENMQNGRRVFDVGLQGHSVLQNFDIVAESGGAMRTLVKEFKGIKVRDALEITLTPRIQAETILCGVEMMAEQ